MTSVLSRENAPHYTWGDACDGWHLLRGEQLSVIEERMPAGRAETRHFHFSAQQCFYILDGEATLELDGREYVVKARQSLAVPAGVAHCIFNRTEAELRFLVISQPATQGDRQAA